MYAFVDEYGECSLNIENSQQSTCFIPTALLIHDKDLASVRAEAEKIRRKHFQNGPIKSSKVGDNHKRRIKILKEIVHLPIRICAVIVDKTALYGKGFEYPASFFKYLNKLLYDQFVFPCPSVRVCADGFGNPDFAKSFGKYIYARYPGWELSQDQFEFDDSEKQIGVPVPSFRMSKSTDEVLLQLTDFIAGSLARIQDPRKHAGVFAEELQILLKPRVHNMQHWPNVRRDALLISFDKFDAIDERIVRLSIRTAIGFIANNPDVEKSNLRARVAVVEFLLSELQYGDPQSYVFSEDIICRVPDIAMREDPERYLRSGVIGALRDSNIPVCSSDRGYKLAASPADLLRFFVFVDGIISPLLDRLLSMRNQIKLATDDDLDLFDIPELQHLGAAAVALSDSKSRQVRTTRDISRGATTTVPDKGNLSPVYPRPSASSRVRQN